MSKPLHIVGLGALAVLMAVPALAQTGSATDPIPLKMKRGTDRIHVDGVLTQNVDCCTYSFKAYAGQTLKWTISGAEAHVVLRYPDGHSDGPLVDQTPLPQDGTYLFSLTPNTMANGAFGPFKLTVTIPPQVITPGVSVDGDKH